MSQVLITGATGLVGGHLLRMLINEPKVNAIAAPTRRPLGDMPGVFNPHDPQLTDALAQVTDPIDIVFCCLGTTRREAGSKEAFIHADYTLVVDTALTGRRLGAQHMLVVSAMGANAHSPCKRLPRRGADPGIYLACGQRGDGRSINRPELAEIDHCSPVDVTGRS